MPLVSFHELMDHARRECYAVGCFETWNLDSLLAATDAAGNLSSPVMLEVSGARLTHLSRTARDDLSHRAAVCLDICRRLTVPVCLMYRESSQLSAVHSALDLGFNLVKFSDPKLANDLRLQITRGLAGWAHHIGAAVQAELQPVMGVAGNRHRLKAAIAHFKMTDPQQAEEFIRQTGIDALDVNVGQCHRHSCRKARLDLTRLPELRQLKVPLVLHDATSVVWSDLRAAVKLGIRKVDVSAALKQVYRKAVCDAGIREQAGDDPFDATGTAPEVDVLNPARLAVQQTVEDFMQLFGSAGKASRVRVRRPAHRVIGEHQRHPVLLSWQTR